MVPLTGPSVDVPCVVPLPLCETGHRDFSGPLMQGGVGSSEVVRSSSLVMTRQSDPVREDSDPSSARRESRVRTPGEVVSGHGSRLKSGNDNVPTPVTKERYTG